MNGRVPNSRRNHGSPFSASLVLSLLLLVLPAQPAVARNLCHEAGLGFPLRDICNVYCYGLACNGESIGSSLQWMCDLFQNLWDFHAGDRVLPCLDADEVAIYSRIKVLGEKTLNGMYDPAIAYDETGVGWMVYTAVVFGSYHHTNLAKTEDNGLTWQFVATVNESRNGTVIQDGQRVSGLWRHEVPTLIHDPTDPDVNGKWKIFWHKYFAKDPGTSIDDRLFDYGWIAYKSAHTPEDLAYAQEVRLFGADPYPRDGATGYTGYPVKHALNRLDDDLNDYVFFSEPGAVVRQGVIYLSADAGTEISGMGRWQNYQTVLFSSPDHGTSWNYVGVLTDFSDALHYGFAILTSTALVTMDDTTYLLATPAGRLSGDNTGHNGVYIFEFTDLSRAHLTRDMYGNLVFKEYLRPLWGARSGGQSTYDPNGGIVMGNIVIGEGYDLFRIFNTGRMIDP